MSSSRQSKDKGHGEMKEQGTELEKICLRLRQNDIDKVSLYAKELEIQNDELALQVATSLQDNTSLDELEMIVGSSVTKSGVTTLIKAIQKSSIKSLSLKEGRCEDQEYIYDEITEVGTWIFTDAIETVTRLKILNPLDDADAQNFGVAMYESNHCTLETLHLKLGNVENKESGFYLFKGIQKSNISNLVLEEVWSQVGKMLLLAGTMSLPTLRHVSIDHCDREDLVGMLRPGADSDSDDDDDDDDDDDQSEDLTDEDKEVSQMETMAMTCFRFLDFETSRDSKTLLKGFSNLKELNLRGNGIQDKGIQYLVKSWKKGSMMQLEKLNLCRNNFRIQGVSVLLSALFTCPSLKHLLLSFNRSIGRDARSDLVSDEDDETSYQPFQLETLDLSWCGLNDMHMELLCKRHFCNSSVKNLRLVNNAIGDVSVECLVNSMNLGFELQCLDLNHNEQIGVNGIQLLLKASAHHPTWIELKLPAGSKNTTSFQNLVILARELASSQLTKLNICHCGVDIADSETSDEATNQRKSRDAACNALLAAVKVNFCLQELNLQDFRIPQPVKDEIQVYLDLNKFGRRSLLQDEVEPTLWSHVLANCQTRPAFIFLLLQEKPMLVPDVMRLLECEEWRDMNHKRQITVSTGDHDMRASKKTAT